MVVHTLGELKLAIRVCASVHSTKIAVHTLGEL